MRVIAIKLGFNGGHRVRIGQEFELAESAMKRDVKRDEAGEPVLDAKGRTVPDPKGKPLLPSWVVEATPENKAKLANGRKFEVQRAKDAALAAAGPKRSRRGFAAEPGAEDLV